MLALALVRAHNSTYIYQYAVYATLYCTSTAAADILAALRILSVGQLVRLCCGRNTKAAAVAEKSKKQQRKKTKRKEKKRMHDGR